MSINYRTISFFLSTLFIFSMGCSDNLSMSGKVVFSDDQSPLTVGVVCFESDKLLAKGVLKENGSYDVRSSESVRGLPPGDYKVYISGASRTEAASFNNAQLLKQIPLIDPKYSNAPTSGLSVTVKRGVKTFDFTVDRPPK